MGRIDFVASLALRYLHTLDHSYQVVVHVGSIALSTVPRGRNEPTQFRINQVS